MSIMAPWSSALENPDPHDSDDAINTLYPNVYSATTAHGALSSLVAAHYKLYFWVGD